MTDTSPEEPKLLAAPADNQMGLVSNVLAIIGFIILIVVLVWGLLHIINISTSSWNSWFKKSPSIEITVPKDAVSGRPATISWKLLNESKSGNYSFMYRCQSGASFTQQGSMRAGSSLPCGVSIAMGSSTSAIFVPVVSGSVHSIPFTVSFFPSDGSPRVESLTTEIAVAPAAALAEPVITETPVATETPKPAVTRPTTHAAPITHSGPADLKVTIIAVGYIDPASDALLMNRALTPGDTVGVEFDIANSGVGDSGTYYFEAHLPTASAYTYTSPAQKSLAPGAHVVNTLRFTQLAPGGGMFTIIADPTQRVNDSNRSNNEVSQVVR